MFSMDHARIRGGSIDLPHRESWHAGDGLEVAGWALGSDSDTSRAEFFVGDEERASLPLHVRRRDVAAHFPDEPSAEFCGFQGWVPMSPSDSEIRVEIVTRSGGRIPFGTVFLETGPLQDVSPGVKRSIIVMYHRVANLPSDPWSLAVSPGHFADQMEVLRRDFMVIPLSRLMEMPLTERLCGDYAAVTFDDGYIDNLSMAKPILERFEIPATVFVTTGALGANVEFWWDELDRIFLQPGKLPETLCLFVDGEQFEADLGLAASYGQVEAWRDRSWRFGYRPPGIRQELYARFWERFYALSELSRRQAMDCLRAWSEIPESARPSHRTLTPAETLQMRVEGLVDIGAHTVSHPALPRLSVDLQNSEIRECASFLEQLLGRRPRSFAYPYGAFGETTVPLVREAGFREAVTTAPGALSQLCDPFCLPRIQVGDWDGDEFAGMLSRVSVHVG